MVGLGDSQTDQRVAAVVVINPNKKTNMEDLLKWCNENMEEAEVAIYDRGADDDGGNVVYDDD